MFIAADELADGGWEIGERGPLDLHHVSVEIGWSTHGLACVVDDVVEAIPRVEDVMAERLDARCVAKVEPEDLEAVTPLVEVGLGRVAGSRVAREPGGHDQRGAAAQQLDAGLVADLDSTTREQSDGSVQVGQLAPLAVVEVGAGEAELVVEVVDGAVLLLAHVAVLQLDRFAERRCVRCVVDGGLDEVVRGKRVRCGEDRLVAQGSDAGLVEQRLVAGEFVGALLVATRFHSKAALVWVGAEDVTCGVEQRSPFLWCQRPQQVLGPGDLA